MSPGRLARVQRRRDIAGGQGRESQRRVRVARDNRTHLGGGLDGRVGGGPGRTRITLVRQHDAPDRETARLEESIVGGFGLGHQLGELCGGSGQIALPYLCRSEAPAALARVVPVADRVGEVASFLTGRARRDRVTRRGCRERLPGEDLARRHRSSTARARLIASAKTPPGRSLVGE